MQRAISTQLGATVELAFFKSSNCHSINSTAKVNNGTLEVIDF